MKGSFTYSELWDLSTHERKWFIQRLNKQFDDEKKMIDDETKKAKNKGRSR